MKRWGAGASPFSAVSLSPWVLPPFPGPWRGWWPRPVFSWPSKGRPRGRPLGSPTYRGLGRYGLGVSWVYVSIQQHGGASPALAGALVVVFVAFLALLPAAFGALYAALAPRHGLGRVAPSCWPGSASRPSSVFSRRAFLGCAWAIRRRARPWRLRGPAGGAGGFPGDGGLWRRACPAPDRSLARAPALGSSSGATWGWGRALAGRRGGAARILHRARGASAFRGPGAGRRAPAGQMGSSGSKRDHYAL